MRQPIVRALLFLLSLTPAWGHDSSILLKPVHGSCGNYRGGLRLVASASPDMGGIAPAALVPVGTVIKLLGISERITLNGVCTVTSRMPVPFRWNLIYRNPGGQETNVPASLEKPNTLTQQFRANNPGVYFAALTAQGQTYSIRVEVIRRGHRLGSTGAHGAGAARFRC